jgi:multidrug efflux pump subunit AcrA (membrane-fusion protein)
VKAIFREEALLHHAGGHIEGDVLRFDPRWVGRAVWVTAAFAIAALLFSAVFTVDEYASGPAVLRVEGRRAVTASVQGAVESIDARPGQKVAVGDALLRISGKEEEGELERARREYDLELVHYLVDPNDVGVRQQLSALKARRDVAKNALDAKTVRATVAGTVSDVRVKPGQPVAPGEVLCSVVPADAQEISLVALVSADYRPTLKHGLAMRFELGGFRYEYADLTVSDVSSEAIGPTEAARILGREHDGALQVDTGGKVLVSATLPASTFVSGGESYRYFDGQTGTAEIRLRREPILVTLVPALKDLFP